jgi:uncharacterized membrane protein (UPF0136 family)
MGTSLRVVAIFAEVVVLMSVIYALFSAVLLAFVDFGLEQTNRKFIGLVMTIIGGLALIFFFGHLIAFYPRIPH